MIISNWIKNYAIDNKIDALVIGISGGIDSAVTSTLCAKTNIPTYVVSLPIHQNKNQLELANLHINWLTKNFKNVHPINVSLSKIFDLFVSNIPNDFKNSLSDANTRSRLRMTTLYYLAQAKNGIVVGTGNKIEDFGVGFFTKYGDGAVDISPIGNLKKSEVYALAQILGILPDIIKAPPTDGLWADDRTDEDQLGCTYEELEWAMEFDGTPNNDRERQILEKYRSLHNKNKHKMTPIPVFGKVDYTRI